MRKLAALKILTKSNYKKKLDASTIILRVAIGKISSINTFNLVQLLSESGVSMLYIKRNYWGNKTYQCHSFRVNIQGAQVY